MSSSLSFVFLALSQVNRNSIKPFCIVWENQLQGEVLQLWKSDRSLPDNTWYLSWLFLVMLAYRISNRTVTTYMLIQKISMLLSISNLVLIFKIKFTCQSTVDDNYWPANRSHVVFFVRWNWATISLKSNGFSRGTTRKYEFLRVALLETKNVQSKSDLILELCIGKKLNGFQEDSMLSDIQINLKENLFSIISQFQKTRQKHYLNKLRTAHSRRCPSQGRKNLSEP